METDLAITQSPDARVTQANPLLESLSAVDRLAWVYQQFPHDRIKLSTSFGAEGMVLLHMLAQQVERPRVFTIDTGRNFQETYDVWQQAVIRYGIGIESWYPDPEDLSALTMLSGPNLFYNSPENRKQCCFVRKVKPMRKALADADVWITGLRRAQSETRTDLDCISYVDEHAVFKLLPLVDWTEQQVWDYIRTHDVPYNKLHDQGYPTIGCQPCTRPVAAGENIRSGRWWWEDEKEKECGIHIENGKVVRHKKTSDWNI